VLPHGGWYAFELLFDKELREHIPTLPMWKLKDQWLTTKQKVGQGVESYAKELLDLEVKIRYCNLGMEMRRDMFVSGLTPN
jgi:hypothetical protein